MKKRTRGHMDLLAKETLAHILKRLAPGRKLVVAKRVCHLWRALCAECEARVEEWGRAAARGLHSRLLEQFAEYAVLFRGNVWHPADFSPKETELLITLQDCIVCTRSVSDLFAALTFVKEDGDAGSAAERMAWGPPFRR